MTNKMVTIIILVFILVTISVGLYWKNMSKAERWLLFNKQVALQYSKQLLTGQATSKTPDNLIDMHISTGAGVVTFDSNDQNNFFVLAYSPNGVPKPLITSGRATTWKKLKDNWYELDIP